MGDGRWKGLLLIVTAGALLPAGNCDDNLGEVEPGPVVFRTSVAPNNLQAEGASTVPSPSADGRFVAFASTAKNLAPPSSAFKEIFVRDRFTDKVINATKLSRLDNQFDLADCEEPVLSPNGRLVAFLTRGALSTFTGVQLTSNCFVIDLMADQTQPIVYLPIFGTTSWPDRDIKNISISNNGRVAFQTSAGNVPVLDSLDSNFDNVFVCQNPNGTPPVITLISRTMNPPPFQVASSNSVEPTISADGSFVVFASQSTDLTADPTNSRRQIFIGASDGSSMEFVSRATGVAGATSDEHCLQPSVSGDGRYVVFLQQDNSVPGPGPVIPGVTGQLVIRRDRLAVPPTTDLVATGPFIFIPTGPLIPLDTPGGASRTSISDDGRFVSFLSLKDTLIDLEVVIRDLQGGLIKPSFALLPSSGFFRDLPSVALSGDGRWVFWSSEVENQVLGDTNSASDIFGYGPLR